MGGLHSLNMLPYSEYMTKHDKQAKEYDKAENKVVKTSLKLAA